MGKEIILLPLFFVLQGHLTLIVRGEFCILVLSSRSSFSSFFLPVHSREIPSSIQAACYSF